MKSTKLHRIALDFRKGILGNGKSNWMCRAVCLPLEGYLRMCGHEVELVDGMVDIDPEVEICHTWLRLPDGQILDPTADQFTTPTGEPMPEVYIGALPEWYLPS